MELDIEHLRSWIGKTEQKSETVTAPLVDRFNATFDIAGEAEDGDVAPLLIHLCLAPPTAPTAGLGEDGHPARGGFLPPVPLPRRMWAAGGMEFHDDIRIGELVTRTSTIRDVVVKEGRSGVLCFVTVDHVITANGRKVITERQDIVYRDVDAPGGAPKKQADPAPQGENRVQVNPSAALLFRYSAITFNGHRIHYDNPYVRNEEGYPGLIVHGPMQATFLLHYAAKLRGQRPNTFEFRSLSPLFDDADFTLNANVEGDEIKLWTSYVSGPTAMQATAKF